MLGEAINERAQARDVVKDGAPLLERRIGGDDDRLRLVPSADDVKEQIGGAAVAGHIAELVEAQHIGGGVAAKSWLGGGVRLLAQQSREGGGEGAEADGISAAERAQAEILRAVGLAEAGLSAQEEVFSTANEVEGGVELLGEPDIAKVSDRGCGASQRAVSRAEVADDLIRGSSSRCITE
jgi:hypothetical protein